MRTIMAILLFLVCTTTQALDFSKSSNNDNGDQTISLIVGKSNSHGWETQLYVNSQVINNLPRDQTPNQTIGTSAVGWNIAAPLIRGKKFTLRAKAGVMNQYTVGLNGRLGLELEYRWKEDKVFVIYVGNTLDPKTMAFTNKLSYSTGFKWYFD